MTDRFPLRVGQCDGLRREEEVRKFTDDSVSGRELDEEDGRKSERIKSANVD